jgi:hypothetical protein
MLEAGCWKVGAAHLPDTSDRDARSATLRLRSGQEGGRYEDKARDAQQVYPSLYAE